MKLLIGHTSPETAFVQPDYPYGRTLRCKRRLWIETKAGHGQRVVAQTTNPKKEGEVWNKPHASTYSTIRIMYLDESNGHVENDGLGIYDIGKVEDFVAKYGEVALFADEHVRKVVTLMRKMAAKRAEKIA